MDAPFRKVSYRLGVLGPHLRWCLGCCDSWCPGLGGVPGRGQVAHATQDEPVLPAHRADCLRGSVPRSRHSRAHDSPKPTQCLPGSPLRSAGTQDRGHWASSKAADGTGVTGWLLKMYFTLAEKSGQPCPWARLCLSNSSKS